MQKVMALAARAGLDWFILALTGMIFLAYLWPEPGIHEGNISLSAIAQWGVVFIFFFYGLRLSPEKLRVGLGHWRLHLVVQVCTFIIFPLLILPLFPLFKGTEAEILWLGTFYLAALPSTVSSSVVMVSIAGGNIPAAIFNASISSLLGVFVTPLWMGLFLTSRSGEFDLWSVMGNLVLQVLAPVLIGIILHKRWGAFAEENRQRLRVFDQLIILLIVYTSFSDSFARKMFAGLALTDLLQLTLGVIALFFVSYAIIIFISRAMGFAKEDQVTALFCGSKKSLVHGTVMSKILFPDATVVGLILLPIMIYHAFQLFIASIIAQRIRGQG